MKIDPRVFVRNFGMQPDLTGAPSQDPQEDPRANGSLPPVENPAIQPPAPQPPLEPAPVLDLEVPDLPVSQAQLPSISHSPSEPDWREVVQSTPRVEEPAPHPWKITDAGSGNVNIETGMVTCYFLTYDDADPNAEPATTVTKRPDHITKGPGATYSGGTEAITGTKYLYAEVARNTDAGGGNSDEYAESYAGPTGYE